MISVILASGCVSQTPSRPEYALDRAIFENLPDFPLDFYFVDFQAENFISDSATESYYKQPEFYPTWETSGVDTFKNPVPDRASILGIGAYPADRTTNIRGDGEVNVTVFFHSSWSVQTYQGMRLNIINPVPEYFDISLDKNDLVLGPNYPKFDNQWAQKVIVRIRSKNAPSGNYTIGLNPSAPPKEKSTEWSQKYRPYIEFFGGLDRPYVRIQVDVGA